MYCSYWEIKLPIVVPSGNASFSDIVGLSSIKYLLKNIKLIFKSLFYITRMYMVYLKD